MRPVVVAAATLATAALWSAPAVAAPPALPDPLAQPQAFADPPVEARPKTRWWWAAPYDAKEFAAEVDAIAAAGFGGAEAAFNTEGWATAEQRDSLKAALEAARRDGIRLDMTLGASWPVTTPNTKPETGLSEQEIYYGRLDLAGASTYAGPAPPPDDDPANTKGAKLVAVTAGRVLEDGQPTQPIAAPNTTRPAAAPLKSTILDTSSLVDLTSRVDGSGVVHWDVPAGRWALFGIWQRPAGEGVMDHLNAASTRAVTQYIDDNQIGPAANPLLPGAARDFFEDSLELDVQEVMWTGRLAAEFRRRRGYDITKYLPVLFVQGMQHYPVPERPPPADFDLPGGAGARVRHDYYETLDDLYAEEHIAVFQKWAETHGMNFRTQPAFGAAFDVTRSAREVARAGGIADDESLNAGDPAPLNDSNWRFALDHFRSVAGGVHQGGGREISTELGAMFFRDQQASLELYKALMDKEWATGITRPIIHGFAYQPPGAAWPGRNQFSTIVAQSWNQRAFPQWAMFRPLNDYWARGNMVLQQGRPQIDVAVYRDGFVTTAATFQALATDAPNYQLDPATGAQVFTDNEGNQRVDDGAKLKPTPLFDGQGLERAGYTFEFVDPVGVREKDAGAGGVLYPDGPAYGALIVDERALPAASAEAIARQAEHGLAVVLVGALPDRGTGLRDSADEDRRVRAAVRRILDAPRTRRVKAQADARAALADLGVEPAASWSRPLPVYSHHRRAGDTDYWYLWNADARPARFTASFRTAGEPSRLDLWTGTITPVAQYRADGGRVRVPLALAPGETRVLAFTRGARERGHVVSTDADEVVADGRRAEARDTAGGRRTVVLNDGSSATLTLPRVPAALSPARWHLHVDEATPEGTTPHDLDLDALADWRDIGELSRASGTGTYTASVTLPTDWVAGDRGAYLELGAAGGAVQAFVNGRRVAPDVTTERRFDVTGLLHAGANELRVVVATTLKNALVGRAQRGDPNQALYLAQPATQPYGLLGPVRLVPFGRAPFTLPASLARRCTSRRRFAVHLRVPRRFRARSAIVVVNGKSRKVRARRTGRRVAVVLDLRRLPKAIARVRVRVRGSGGRSARTTRTYRLCAKRR